MGWSFGRPVFYETAFASLTSKTPLLLHFANACKFPPGSITCPLRNLIKPWELPGWRICLFPSDDESSCDELCSELELPLLTLQLLMTTIPVQLGCWLLWSLLPPLSWILGSMLPCASQAAMNIHARRTRSNALQMYPKLFCLLASELVVYLISFLPSCPNENVAWLEPLVML